MLTGEQISPLHQFFLSPSFITCYLETVAREISVTSCSGSASCVQDHFLCYSMENH